MLCVRAGEKQKPDLGCGGPGRGHAGGLEQPGHSPPGQIVTHRKISILASICNISASFIQKNSYLDPHCSLGTALQVRLSHTENK